MTNEVHNHQLSALDQLFRTHYKALRTYAFRYVDDKSIAEDIVQDVFIELWNRRDHIRFNEPEAVKSYLFKSVYNRSMNCLNASIVNIHSSLDDVDEEIIIDHRIHSYLSDQEQSLLLKELEEEIAAFVETLPPQCKNIFILSRKHELKNKEIAEQLNISIKAVEKQITKALAELKKHLLKKGLLFIAFILHYHL
jgi:RNA polymerase sigma-70 factor (ECF subfamily)